MTGMGHHNLKGDVGLAFLFPVVSGQGCICAAAGQLSAGQRSWRGDGEQTNYWTGAQRTWELYLRRKA